ncbi:MAG: hypothetical protein CMJ32_02830 [Phycisphaerae bacterium]|nr:hypothetical protein [Phycisphaerae bacterium]
MGLHVRSYESTPNPNAVKCLLTAPISDRPRSFRTPQDAAGDPLASRLFLEAGLTCLYLCGDWMTINKDPADQWAPIKDAVEKVLSEHEPGGGA